MKIQTCNRPLEKISRRLIEIFHIENENQRNVLTNLHEEREFSPIVQYELPDNEHCYSKITIKPGVVLTSRKMGDQWFLTRSGDIIKMIYAKKVENSYKICGLTVKAKSEFFSKPIKSTSLNIFKSDADCLSTEECMHELNSIAAKMICLHLASEFVFIPILHTLEILK